MKRFLAPLLTVAALVAAPAAFADDVKFPSITPTCVIDHSTCIDGYVTRPGITVETSIGAGNFDSFIKKNGLEGWGITPETVLPVGPLTVQS